MPASLAHDAARPRSMADYAARLKQAGLAPLWDSMAALAPFEPKAQAAPHLWPYEATRALLMEAGVYCRQIRRR